MIRLAYYEHPDYVPLLRRAYALWDELEQASGEKVLYRTGGIYMGPPAGEVVAGFVHAGQRPRAAPPGVFFPARWGRPCAVLLSAGLIWAWGKRGRGVFVWWWAGGFGHPA